MTSIQTIKDSVRTSVTIKLFKTDKESAYAHIFRPVDISNRHQNVRENRGKHYVQNY